MNRYKHILILVVAVAASLFVLSSHKSVSALALTTQEAQGGQYHWVDMSNIQGVYKDSSGNTVGTVNYFDGNGLSDYWDLKGGGEGQYVNTSTCAGNPSDVYGNPSQPNAKVKVTVYYSDPRAGANGGCLPPYNSPDGTLSISQGQNANISYRQNGNTLERVDGNAGYVFKQTDTKNPQIFYKTNGSSQCKDEIVLSSATATGNVSATLYQLTSGNGNLPGSAHAEGCTLSGIQSDVLPPTYNSTVNNGSSQFDIHVDITTNPTQSVSGAGGSGSSGPAVGGQGSAPVSCSVDANPLTWLTCPLIKMMTDITQSLGNALAGLLLINVGTGNSCGGSHGGNCANSAFGATNPNGHGGANPVYVAWDSIRIISMVLIVIVALVMVISQALSVGPFDAYTVKKVLPKLLIAIIAITLSWDLCKLAISFVDDLGNGVQNLLLAPFNGAGVLSSVSVNGSTLAIGSFAVAGGAVVLVTAIVAGVFSLGIIFSLIAVILFSILTTFAVVILRYILIITLVIFAPIAIIFWILPGTQNLWKMWSSNFIKALLMYPIIMAFLATGIIFSTIISSGGVNISGGTGDGTGVNTITNIIAIAVIFLPYFFIPATFKMSGAAIAAVGGMAAGLSKNFGGRQKKYRAGKLAEGIQKAKSGDVRGGVIGGAYKRLGEASNAGFKGGFGFGAKGEQARAQMANASVEDTLKNNARLRALAVTNEDGNAVLALSGGTSTGGTKARDALKASWMEDGMSEADADKRADKAFSAAQSVGFNAINATAALTTLAQNKSRPIGAGKTDLIANGIQALSNGNAQMAEDLAYGYQFNSRNAGRNDLGGAWHYNSSQDKAEALVASAAARGVAMSNEEALTHTTMLDAMGRTDAGAMVRGHSSQVKQTAKTIEAMLDNGSNEQRISAGQKLLELQNSLPYATDDNKTVINKMMSDLGLHPEGITETIEETRKVTLTDAHGDAVLDTSGNKQLVDQVFKRQSTQNLSDQIARGINATAAAGRGTTSAAPPTIVTGSELNAGARVFDRDPSYRDGLEPPKGP